MKDKQDVIQSKRHLFDITHDVTKGKESKNEVEKVALIFSGIPLIKRPVDHTTYVTDDMAVYEVKGFSGSIRGRKASCLHCQITLVKTEKCRTRIVTSVVSQLLSLCHFVYKLNSATQTRFYQNPQPT